jgi:bifunctional UDP-N-acetylglucosamine pyrophosphorylase/glucosamine-1-phosphate N-acetyltransferase
VPPGAMAVGRARQRNVEGWVERKRPGTASAAAAERARQQSIDENPSE